MTKNKEMQDPNKLSKFVNFFDPAINPVDTIVSLAKQNIAKLNLAEKSVKATDDTLNTITGVNTKLANDRTKLRSFVFNFVNDTHPAISVNHNILFLEMLYMEIDKKAKGKNKGVVLTPAFAAQLMVDLAKLDYTRKTLL